MNTEKANQFLADLFNQKNGSLSAMDLADTPRWSNVSMRYVWGEVDLESALSDDWRHHYCFNQAIEDAQKRHDRFLVTGIFDRESKIPVAMVMSSGVFLMEGARI